MYSEAKRMADYAVSQTWLTGIGAVLVFGSLLLALQANKAARGAVDVTRSMGRAQTRAYLSISSAYFYVSGEADIVLGIRNTGLTPVKWFDVASRVKRIKSGDDAEFTANSENVEVTRWNKTIYGEEVCIPAFSLVPTEYPSIREMRKDLRDSQGYGIAVEGFLRWETIFDEVFESEFYFFSGGSPNAADKNGRITMAHPSIQLGTYKILNAKNDDD
jgi:hypothetical protein